MADEHGIKYLKPSEKKDVVLSYLKNHPDIELTTGNIAGYAELNNPGAIPLNELSEILTSLADARHIHVITPGLYQVTFEGIVFMDNGGYSLQREEKNVKRRYIRYTQRVGNETSSLSLWFIGILILFAAYFIFSYGYHNWNWKIPF